MLKTIFFNDLGPVMVGFGIKREGWSRLSNRVIGKFEPLNRTLGMCRVSPLDLGMEGEGWSRLSNRVIG